MKRKIEEYKEHLKGKTASMSNGVIFGEVYVLLDFEKVDQFKKGSILITEQTSPECITAMENSLAVITERGGILCHAAIVSRDLGIPCIVGVRGILSQLKTGQKIAISTIDGKIYYN